MYLDTYRFDIDPNGGTLNEKINGVEDNFNDYTIMDTSLDPDVITGYGLVTSPELRLIVNFSPNSGTVARSGEVTFEIKMDKYDDPESETPVIIDSVTDYLNFEYIQSIHVEEVEVPEYNPDPDDPESCTPPPDSDITSAQSELNDGGILNDQTISTLKKSLLIEQNGLDKENKKARKSAESDLERVKKLEKKLAKYKESYFEEYHKKNKNKSKLDNLAEKVSDTEEKINDIKRSLDSLLHNDEHDPDFDYESNIESYFDTSTGYSPYIDERYEQLSSSSIGMEMDNEFLKFNKNFDYLQRFVPKIIQNLATAFLEPTTAVVVTPTGAGSVAANPLQSMGTLQRISGQVLDLYPVILDLINQCRILKLPDNIFKVVDKIAKMIKPLASLIS